MIQNWTFCEISETFFMKQAVNNQNFVTETSWNRPHWEQSIMTINNRFKNLEGNLGPKK